MLAISLPLHVALLSVFPIYFLVDVFEKMASLRFIPSSFKIMLQYSTFSIVFPRFSLKILFL